MADFEQDTKALETKLSSAAKVPKSEESYFRGKPGGFVDRAVGAVFGGKNYDEDGRYTGAVSQADTAKTSSAPAPPSPAIATPAPAPNAPVAPATARPEPAANKAISTSAANVVQNAIAKMGLSPEQFKRFDVASGKAGPGVVANGSRSDWSNGSANTAALSQINMQPSALTSYSSKARTDEFGRALPDEQITANLGTMSNRNLQGMTYDQQVAKAQEVNAANERFNAINMSPRERAAFENMSNTKMGSFTRSGAAAEVEAFKARRDAYLGKEKNDQALALGKQQSDDRKYAADQALSGHKMTADATRYKADRDAEGDKLKVDAAIKTGKDSQRSDSIKALSTSIEQKTKALEGIVDPRKRETAMVALEKDHARLAKLAGFEDSGEQAASKLPKGMKRQVGTSGGKPVYEDEKGNRHIMEG